MSSEITTCLCQQGAECAGQKAGRILVRSMQAGLYIGLAALFTITVTDDAKSLLGSGLTQLLAGFCFSAGLIMVVLGGAELFTGCNLTVGTAAIAGEVPFFKMLRQWSLCYVGNLLGSMAIVALWIGSGLWRQADGAWAAKALAMAGTKANLDFWPALLMGIGCNILVCLGVFFAAGAKDTAGKVAGMLFPVMAFVAMGFEHSVANMTYLPLGLWLQYLLPAQAQAGLGGWALLTNLVPVTIGNIIGGTLVVGATYWGVFGQKPKLPVNPPRSAAEA